MTATTPTSDRPRTLGVSALTATLDDAGGAELDFYGAHETLKAANVAEAREEVLARATAYARDKLGLPLSLTAHDPDGTWQLLVHPSGEVHELDTEPNSDLMPETPLLRPPRPAPPPIRRRRHWRWRRWGRVAAVCVCLLAPAAVIAAIVVNSGASSTPQTRHVFARRGARPIAVPASATIAQRHPTSSANATVASAPGPVVATSGAPRRHAAPPARRAKRGRHASSASHPRRHSASSRSTVSARSWTRPRAAPRSSALPVDHAPPAPVSRAPSGGSTAVRTSSPPVSRPAPQPSPSRPEPVRHHPDPPPPGGPPPP